MIRSELELPRRSPVLTLMLMVIVSSVVFATVEVVAKHCWRDDARAALLHTRSDPMMFGAATVGVRETPCIVRSETDNYDCTPVTTLIGTSAALALWTPSFWPRDRADAIEHEVHDPNPGATSVTDIGVFNTIDTDKMSVNPCAQADTPLDQRFVAQVVDKAHHRTVYVPCEGIVYVVPDL